MPNNLDVEMTQMLLGSEQGTLDQSGEAWGALLWATLQQW